LAANRVQTYISLILAGFALRLLVAAACFSIFAPLFALRLPLERAAYWLLFDNSR
jgi:hypothetical protein